MAVKIKNKIIKDLLQELNAVKSSYGRTDVSEAEKEASDAVSEDAVSEAVSETVSETVSE